MKILYLALPVLAGALLFCFMPARAETPQKKIIDQFMVSSGLKGCDADLAQYCTDITPGRNRKVYCLMAHEDKIQNTCRAGLMESSLNVQLGVASLDYAYENCREDRVNVCGNVEVGEGRVINCMKSNESRISGACINALKETGFWNAILEPASGE